MTRTLTINRNAAIRAATKRLPIRGDKALEANLEMAVGSLAEAYRIGAEEAQHEIAQRLMALPASKVTS
jgi:hypothetical protein